MKTATILCLIGLFVIEFPGVCSGKNDLAVYDGNSGYWYVSSLNDRVLVWGQQWGWPDAVAVPGDYDGNGKDDMAVYDQASGSWYVLSIDGELITWGTQWGWTGATPVPGDYDGDGADDLAVYDNDGGRWYIYSLDGVLIAWADQWGWSGATVVPGDYDGDGADDLAVYDGSGSWYIRSIDGSVIFWGKQWGWAGAETVPGDYDGDGKNDLAVYDQNTGHWYILSATEELIAWDLQWGWPGADVLSGDYDGDGCDDLAVYDQTDGNWYILSAQGELIEWSVQWGWSGAEPVSGNYGGLAVRPSAVATISSGETKYGVKLLSSDYVLDVIVPPSETSSAPFDSEVLSDGTILVSGPQDTLVSVGEDGSVNTTSYPNTSYFDAASNDSIWFYEFCSGEISRYDSSTQMTRLLATLEATYTDGALAAVPDGTAAYIGWWKEDLSQSALYKYDLTNGLSKILDQNVDENTIKAVEVTVARDVYVGTAQQLFKLNGNTLVSVLSNSFGDLLSDALTSDLQGNLYFSAETLTGPGLHKFDPVSGTMTTIKEFRTTMDYVPYGLSWDEDNQTVIGVIKEKGELVSVDMSGNMTVLNDPSGLITPIAMREDPDHRLFINGDEVGLLELKSDSSVTTYLADITCYQPPQADFVFDSFGSIYYSYAAPGFDSKIVKINTSKAITNFATDVDAPAGLALDSEGRLYYADSEDDGVYLLDNNGNRTLIIGGLNYPIGLVVDSNGTFWVGSAKAGTAADSLGGVPNNVIYRFEEGGSLETVVSFSDSDFHSIIFFDVDENGILYFTDDDKLKIRKTDGTLTTIAQGFSQLATARIVDDGSIYLVDYGAAALYRLISKDAGSN